MRTLHQSRFNSIVAAIGLSAAGISASLVMAEIPQGKFTRARNIGRTIDDTTFEMFPNVTPDGLQLIFAHVPPGPRSPNVKDRPDAVGSEDLYIATRASVDDPFEMATSIDEINTPFLDTTPRLSPDGLTIYFCSDRESDKCDLYQATRDSFDSPFENVMPILEEGINTDASEATATVTADRLTMVFNRTDGPISTTPRELWIAERESTDQPFANPMPLNDEINRNSPSFPSISADGLFLFWGDWDHDLRSPRPGGKGGLDIWVASRESRDDEFDEPVNLNDMWPGTRVNNSGPNAIPYISADWPEAGSKLYYVGSGGGDSDIYEATWEPVLPTTAGDFNGNGMRDVADLDLLADAMGGVDGSFDLNDDGNVNFEDRRIWVEELSNTFIGDANFDGEFNSSDFVTVFDAAKYEKSIPATWSEGDWDGDSVFSSADFVAAFAGSGYESGPRDGGLQTVPEPGSITLILFGFWGVVRTFRHALTHG